MFGTNKVNAIIGRTILHIPLNCLISPHSIPKMANITPEKPIVGEVYHVGMNEQRKAIIIAGVTFILFLSEQRQKVLVAK